MTEDRKTYRPGDRVRHEAKPEWGVGTVEEVQPVTQDGRPCQRLVVNFAHRGRTTVNTLFARITPLGGNGHGQDHADAPADRRSSGGGWLQQLEGKSGDEALTDLPEATRDPFSSPARRLKATLDLYRFTDEPRSLLDWAVAQTGEDDPLSHRNRHELEQAFEQYKRVRDQHLLSLLRTVDEGTLQAVAAEAPEAARRKIAELKRRR